MHLMTIWIFLSSCKYKLGVSIEIKPTFAQNKTSMCLDPHLKLGLGWRRETGLSPPVKYFY